MKYLDRKSIKVTLDYGELHSNYYWETNFRAFAVIVRWFEGESDSLLMLRFPVLSFRAVETQSEGQCAPVDSLWRRYSEFELLRNYLSVTYPHIVVPPLPEKRVRKLRLQFTLYCLLFI